MAKEYIFRPNNSDSLRWHPELGVGDNLLWYFEYMWCDGPLKGDDGKDYYLRMSVYNSVPKGSHGAPTGGLPGIGFDLLLPNGKVIDEFIIYKPEEFKDLGFGGIWGANKFTGNATASGQVIDYAIDMKFLDGAIEVKLDAKAIAGGVQFVHDKHGYTFYDKEKNMATGWWPLAVCSEVTGYIKHDGKIINMTGKLYLDRQVGNMPKTFGTGPQAWWTWGHFWAGDYSGTFTDTAPSSTFKYRHFSPFVLFKGSELLLATTNFTGYIEEYAIDEVSGKFYPKEQSQRAIDGTVRCFTQITNGVLVEPSTTSLEETAKYVRQFADIKLQLMRFGGFREDVEGKIVIEFGAGYHFLPFDKLV